MNLANTMSYNLDLPRPLPMTLLLVKLHNSILQTA